MLIKRTMQAETGLSPEMIEYLLVGEWPRDAKGEFLPGYLMQAFTKTGDELTAIWLQHRDSLMAEWERRGGVGLPAGERLARMPRRSKWSKPPSVQSSRRRTP